MASSEALAQSAQPKASDPPSTRSRWEVKARLIQHLLSMLPICDVMVEDVQALPRKGKGGRWNGSLSPVQVGKEHLYRLLGEMGLSLHLREGWQTKELRDTYGLKKTRSKSRQSFDSHTVDSWVLAASISGGERKPYGGSRSLGLKRGTLITHKKYRLCTMGGFDRKKQSISLQKYRTNKRLTQAAKVKDCRALTWVAFRCWLVAKERQAPHRARGATLPKPPAKERLFLPPRLRGRSPQAQGR